MQIGTGLFTGQQRPDDDRSNAQRYDELLTLARAIDEAGLDSAWVSEHHFADDGYLSGTMPTLGAIAAETESIELGTCIALAPLYDPVRLAEDAATVDLISDGRLTLGLSIGYRDVEFENFGVPKEERVERTRETVSLLQEAWSDEPIETEYEYHAIEPGTSITPTPTGEQPTIMLGGKAKSAVRRAARIGDGWCAPSSLSIGGLKKRVEDIHSVREQEEIEGEFTTYVLQHGFVGDSREEAWETMRDGYLYLQRRYAEWFSGESIDELPPERVEELKDQAIFGTPEQVIEELETYRDALGDDTHFIFRTYHPGIGTDEMVECIDRLGESVVPHFA